jgi:hypothetical protein
MQLFILTKLRIRVIYHIKTNTLKFTDPPFVATICTDWPLILFTKAYNKEGGIGNPRFITYAHYFFFEKYMWVPKK